MPTNIRKKSEIEQIRQTINVNCFFKPCSITNIFWAPIANIKLRLVKKRNNKNSKIFNYLLKGNIFYSDWKNSSFPLHL